MNKVFEKAVVVELMNISSQLYQLNMVLERHNWTEEEKDNSEKVVAEYEVRRKAEIEEFNNNYDQEESKKED